MNDKTYRKERARVLKRLRHWREPMGVGWWKIEFVWFREEKTTDHSSKAEWLTYFSVVSDWKYRTAVLNCYLGSTLDLSEDVLDRSIIHEFCHIIVNPMSRERHRDEEELVCESLALAIQSCYAAGVRSGQKSGRSSQAKSDR